MAMTKFELYVYQASQNLGVTKPFNIDTAKVLDWLDNENPPTDEALSAEIDRLEAEYNANQYQRDRLTEYPSIQELVVALYDEEDKQAIIERRSAVKAKYPKPE